MTLYLSNLKIRVQSCFCKAHPARCSSFLRTGLKVLDAASYVVAGVKLQKKLDADQRQHGGANRPNDPVVKQMNEAIEKAKDRKHGLAPAETGG